MLYLDEKNGEVRVMLEAIKSIPVQALYKKERQKEKRYFNDAITYIYHVYKKDHYYNYMSFTERKEQIIKQYLPHRKASIFDKDKEIQALIKAFLATEYTTNEMFYEGIKEDMTELKAHIRSIKLTKKGIVVQPVEVEVVEDGKKVKKIANVKVEVDVDNSNEKLEAIKIGKSLIAEGEAYLSLIEKEKIGKATGKYESLLESGTIS